LSQISWKNNSTDFLADVPLNCTSCFMAFPQVPQSKLGNCVFPELCRYQLFLLCTYEDLVPEVTS
jgi:hypothetical protein